jgi:hypothetical protein
MRGGVKLITLVGSIPRAVWIPTSMIPSRTEKVLISHGAPIFYRTRFHTGIAFPTLALVPPLVSRGASSSVWQRRG